ncbi:MAG TPA: hypothetical protein VNG33_10600 [Polyangiaceae bacterium]|nr:hypothetical protein [Polyangiaceae bacterium]
MPAVRLARALAVASLLVSASAVATEPSAEARRLYAEGKAEYAQGHYAEAVRLFERSYALSESPALLFNMAQAHRLAGPEHCADAVALYKSYLQAQPDAENKKEVEERIQQLGDCAPQPASAAAPAAPAPAAASPAPPSAQPPPPKPLFIAQNPSHLPTGPVLVTGTGAALLVAGGVLYSRAWSKHREAEKLCPCYPGTYSSWEVLTNVSYALLAVGGATLAGGVTWWIVTEPRSTAQPSRAMLGISGRF